MAEPLIEARAAAVAFGDAWATADWDAMVELIQRSRRQGVARQMDAWLASTAMWEGDEAPPAPPYNMAERLRASFGAKVLQRYNVLSTAMVGTDAAMASCEVGVEYEIAELGRFKAKVRMNVIREDESGAPSVSPAAGFWGVNDTSALRESARRPLPPRR